MRANVLSWLRFPVLVAAVAVLSLAAAPAALAQVTFVGSPRHGGCFDADVSGGTGVMGQGQWVTLFTTAGVVHGSIKLNAQVACVSYQGNRSYAITKAGRFYILDTSTPGAPLELHSADVFISPNQCAFANNRLFVADLAGTIKVIGVTGDVSSLLHMRLNTGRFLAIRGNKAYTYNGLVLDVFDITDVTDWQQTGSLSLLGASDMSISADGTRVYAGAVDFMVIDISGPGDPVLVTTLATSGLVLSVECPSTSGDVFIVEGAYLADKLVRRIDVSDEQALSVVTSAPIGNVDPTALVADPSTGADQIVVAQENGVRVFDATPAPRMSETASFNSGHYTLESLLVGTHLVTVSVFNGLEIFDVGSPTNPFLVSSLSWVAATSGLDLYVPVQTGAKQAAVGPYAVVAASEDGLRVVDLTNLAAPVQAGSLLTSSARDVTVRDGLAYVADGADGLRIVSLADPSQPAQTGTYDTPGFASAVALNGNYAYVVDGFLSGIIIVDVSNPNSPFRAGGIANMDFVLSVATRGNYAYFGDRGSLRIFELTDPVNPTPLVFYDLGAGASVRKINILLGSGGSVAGSDSQGDIYAYVGAGAAGLKILDLTTPNSPNEIGAYDSPGFAEHAFVDASTVYLSDGFTAFSVLDYDAPTTAALIAGFAAELADGAVSLRWRVETDESLSGFRVERSVGGHTQSVAHVGAAGRSFVDGTVVAGTKYSYTLYAITRAGVEYGSWPVTVSVPGRVASMLSLHPNPFNPTTTIVIDMVEKGRARLNIYDAEGRLVVRLLNEELPAGREQVVWNGRDAKGSPVSSGVYLARLRVGKNVVTSKAVLLK